MKNLVIHDSVPGNTKKIAQGELGDLTFYSPIHLCKYSSAIVKVW